MSQVSSGWEDILIFDERLIGLYNCVDENTNQICDSQAMKIFRHQLFDKITSHDRTVLIKHIP